MSGSLKEIHQQVCDAASELCEKSEIPAGTLFVVGCSSSEISGHAIGAQPAPHSGENGSGRTAGSVAAAWYSPGGTVL